MKEVNHKSEPPKHQHYAALEFTSKQIYHRSQTYPGHGYSDYNETVNSTIYRTFENVEEMKAWILKADKQGASYQIVEVRPIQAQITAQVELT